VHLLDSFAVLNAAMDAACAFRNNVTTNTIEQRQLQRSVMNVVPLEALPDLRKQLHSRSLSLLTEMDDYMATVASRAPADAKHVMVRVHLFGNL
jgi:hypothetical protein